MRYLVLFASVCSLVGHAELQFHSMDEAAKRARETKPPALYLIELTDKTTQDGKTVRELVEVERDGKGELPKLLPKRVYRRWDAGLKKYVYEVTNDDGMFVAPSRSLVPHSTLPGHWFGRSKSEWYVLSPGKEADPVTKKFEDWRKIEARDDVAAEYTYYVQSDPPTHVTYDYPDSSPKPLKTSLVKDSNSK